MSHVIVNTPGNQDLVTLSKVKTILGISGTAQDTRIQALITAMSSSVSSFCNRVFMEENVTEVKPGSGMRELVLTRFPIQSVDTVEVDGTEIDDYEVHRISLYRELAWPRRLPGRLFGDVPYADDNAKFNVSVTYSGGFPAGEAPEDLQYAVSQLVGQVLTLKEQAGAPVTLMRVGDYQVSFVSGNLLPQHVSLILTNYQRIV